MLLTKTIQHFVKRTQLHSGSTNCVQFQIPSLSIALTIVIETAYSTNHCSTRLERKFQNVPAYESIRQSDRQSSRDTSSLQILEKVIPATMPVTSIAPPIIPATEAFSGATVLKTDVSLATQTKNQTISTISNDCMSK